MTMKALGEIAEFVLDGALGMNKGVFLEAVADAPELVETRSVGWFCMTCFSPMAALAEK